MLDWSTATAGPTGPVHRFAAAWPHSATRSPTPWSCSPTGRQLDPRAVERLIERRGDAPVVAASYENVRSHPVVLSREIWSTVPDEGARALEPVLVDCSDLEPPGDVDFPPTGEV